MLDSRTTRQPVERENQGEYFNYLAAKRECFQQLMGLKLKLEFRVLRFPQLSTEVVIFT